MVPQRREPEGNHGVLGGSGVVVSGVISPLIWVISIVTLLITLLITTHEPPSKPRPPPETSCAVGACRRPQRLSPSCMQKVQDPLPVSALAFGFRFRVGFSEDFRSLGVWAVPQLFPPPATSKIRPPRDFSYKEKCSR